MRTLLLTLILSLSASSAFAQADVQQVAGLNDSGFRLHAALGYPSVMALGIGWKVGRTEVLAQAGGLALWAFIVGTAEASATYDFVHKPWGALHFGAAGSLLHTHAFVIDCYEGETCEDQLQMFWLASPRLGARLRLDRRKQHGVLPYVELAAGPQIGRCVGRCPDGDFVLNAAVSFRGLLDFRGRPKE